MGELVELSGLKDGEPVTCVAVFGDHSDFESVPVERRVMVIGAGITGITSSIDLGNAGYQVMLVDRLPSVGGRML
ncbi:MAG: NAD(P)-binding protein, partial [Deltaproteobacteria bacterium]|nr:NAD(P)-binding protein [Candidatus Tharpella sp.]